MPHSHPSIPAIEVGQPTPEVKLAPPTSLSDDVSSYLPLPVQKLAQFGDPYRQGGFSPQPETQPGPVLPAFPTSVAASPVLVPSALAPTVA